MKFTLQEPEDTELIRLLTKATSNDSEKADWTLFINICHKINQTKQSGKTVRKFLQKNLTTKQPQTQMLTLALLKVISENCPQFDEQLANSSLIKALQSTYSDPETNKKVNDIFHQCVQIWSLEFGRTQPNHPILRLCYQVNQIDVIQTQYNASSTPPHVDQQVLNRSQSNHHDINRKPSLFRGWKLKKSTSSEIPPSLTTTQFSQQKPLPNPLQSPQTPHPPTGNKGEKILISIEESKTTSHLLIQVLSENQLQDDDSLVKELYEKCQELQKTIMQYIEETEDPVYLSTLIDTNNIIIKAMDTYERNKQDNQQQQQQNNDIPKIIMTEKALGKQPIRRNDLLV
ncbi:hypothetical protein BJ944DRAFT_268372 [Cunninghamella echinulata]|nr:hypothetical protein BJ944DRAFT_268372 [Cunninghamella echinulata]